MAQPISHDSFKDSRMREQAIKYCVYCYICTSLKSTIGLSSFVYQMQSKMTLKGNNSLSALASFCIHFRAIFVMVKSDQLLPFPGDTNRFSEEQPACRRDSWRWLSSRRTLGKSARQCCKNTIFHCCCIST